MYKDEYIRTIRVSMGDSVYSGRTGTYFSLIDQLHFEESLHRDYLCDHRLVDKNPVGAYRLARGSIEDLWGLQSPSGNVRGVTIPLTINLSKEATFPLGLGQPNLEHR